MRWSRLLWASSHSPSPPPVGPPLPPPPLPPTERTLADGDRHQTAGAGRHGYREHQEGQGNGNSGKRSDYENNVFGSKPRKKTKKPRGRWSFILQDIPSNIVAALNDMNRGYALRVASAVGVVVGVGALVYYGVLVPHEEKKPLAQRCWLFSPRVPVTLTEKTREEGSNMYRLRFQLPNSYDYAGYEPVSSVRLYSGNVRQLSSLSRWYTPISRAEERGFIEFAIKDCDPGRMSSRMRYLLPGDVVYLGRWMKEFDYSAVKRSGGELGLICSTAGASVALQLMTAMEAEERDHQHRQVRSEVSPTRLQLLYCHRSALNIPFKRDYFDRYEREMPHRISVKYNVLSTGGSRRGSGHPADPSLVIGENCFVGHLDPAILQVALPPPVRATAVGEAKREGEERRPHILVCGPQSMMSYLCGRVSPISNYTYWQGWWFRYTGMLKDMGYDRSQVFKFGVSTHYLAIH